MNENNHEERDMTELALERGKVIVRTSIVGIVANILLAAFKAAIGLISNSIAVVLDAVNNLSDALSSIVTIIGSKFSSKLPDKKHPLGHGRAEYLSALVVAALVLYAGVTSLVESIKKVIKPETPEYSWVSLAIIGVAVIVKLLLGAYFKRQGKAAGSSALEASGADASFDAILSLSVLASALVFTFTGLSLEAYVGALISVFIIKSGIEMMIDTLNDILGRRADPVLTAKIRSSVLDESEVRGVYDIFLNDYGPGKNYCSLHVELPDTMSVEEVDKLTRRIQARVYRSSGVILTGVGVYSYNTQDNEAAHIRNRVMELVLAHEWALQLHGFHADTDEHTMRFDVVLSFDVKPQDALKELCEEIGREYPDYKLQISPDVDLADI